MNLKLSVTAVAITTALLTGNAQAAEQLTATEAFGELSNQAVDKIRNARIDVNALMTNDSNDFIIHFDKEAFPTSASSSNGNAPRTYRSVKDAVLNDLNNTTVMRDYYNSATSFVRVSSKEDLVSLLNNPNVVSVVPNRHLSANLDRSLKLIKQPEAEALRFQPKGARKASQFDGEGSVIAILDTGLNPRHSDFGNCNRGLNSSGCKVANVVELANESWGRPDGRYDDGSNHGTNVSAIAGSVAPAAKLVGLDVFRFATNPRTGKRVHTVPFDSIQAGLNYVKNNHKNNNPRGYNFVSANMSIGGSEQIQSSQNELPIVGELKDLGVATVAASGNDGYTRGVNWPAAERDIIAVGAVYDTDAPYSSLNCPRNRQRGLYADEVACFSNTGSLIDLLAPGVNISAGGLEMTGTSMASPHVAGAYAVLRAPAVLQATKSRRSGVESVDATTRRLKNSGVSISDYRTGSATPRINLLAATQGIAKKNPVGGYTPPNDSKPNPKPKPVDPVKPKDPVKNYPPRPTGNPFYDCFILGICYYF